MILKDKNWRWKVLLDSCSHLNINQILVAENLIIRHQNKIANLEVLLR